ncbi:MAG: ABC transporter permease [Thermomicrobiales bacterium]
MARGALAKGLPIVKPEPLVVRPRRANGLFRRLIRSPLIIFWGGVLLVLVLLAIFAPIVAPYDPIKQSADLLQPPSRQYLFGTDELGRDILSRIIFGARISLTVGLIAVGIAGSIGTVIGLISGFIGGALDNVIMRIIDVLLAFPGIILAILIMATLGASLVNVVIAVGIGAIPLYARTVRGATLAVKENDYILAARALGANAKHIMFRHVLPNVIGPVIVLGTVGIAGTIIAISGLSFLGLGAKPPSPEWGAMLSQARIYLRKAWWLTTFPGLAIMISVFAINLIGDALRDTLDPRLRGTIKD